MKTENQDPQPDELSLAMPCDCGGHAVVKPPLGRWDIKKLQCSNCGFALPYFRLGAAVSEWNSVMRLAKTP